MSRIESRLRDALYRSGRDIIEKAADPDQQKMLNYLRSKGPEKCEQWLNDYGNAYANAILPVILPIITERLEENQP